MRAAITVDASGYRRSPIYPHDRTYRPHFVVDGYSSMLGVQIVNGPESISPGETAEVEFECIYDVSYDALQRGVRFKIVEGAHQIGRGIILARTP